MPRRRFLPPGVCSQCSNVPFLGETLIHTGEAWLCAACLTEQTKGGDISTKAASHSLQSEDKRSSSKRDRAAGYIEGAVVSERSANWHSHAAARIRNHGNRLALLTEVAQGEAVPASGYLKDTLVDPDLVAVESSYARGRLLHVNDAVALGLDVSNTAQAGNTHEKLLAHQIAVAHKVALEQTAAANWDSTNDPAMAMKRLQIAARMMATSQQAMLTLQKLKTGGSQTVVVQHVTVSGNAQAVIGNVAQPERGNREAIVSYSAHPHAGNFQSEQSKLLEVEHGKRVDFGAQAAAGSAESDLTPVGAIHRAEVGSG